MIDTMNGCGAPLVLAMQIFEARDRHALLHSFDELVAHHLDDVTIGGRLVAHGRCMLLHTEQSSTATRVPKTQATTIRHVRLDWR